MDITVKNVKEHKELSDDSMAFSCTVYVDGQKVGTATDDGNGGMVRLDVDGKTYKAMQAYAKTIPAYDANAGDKYGTGEPLMIQPDAESLVQDKVIEALEIKDMKKVLSKRFVYVQDGNLYQTKVMPTKQVKAILARPDADEHLETQLKSKIILNRLLDSLAFIHWKANMK